MEANALELIGNGDGCGNGYGNGDGCGNGYGNGYGDGYGNGYGDGDGNGNGYGYGDGGELYINALTAPHAKDGYVVAVWRSNMDGTPANGGKGTKAQEGATETLNGNLAICRHGFHATTQPEKWAGARWWIVLLKEPVQRQDDKIASLERIIVKDLGRCPFK